MTKVQDIPWGLRGTLAKDLLYKIDEIIRRANAVLSTDEVLGTDNGIVVTENADGTITLTISDNYLPTNVLGTSNEIVVTDNGDGTITISFASPLVFSSAIATPFATKTDDYTLTATDSNILADALNKSFTITVPTAVGVAGREYHLKRKDDSDNVVSVVATVSTEKIDGANSLNLNQQYEAITIKSDGANWHIF